MTAAGGSVIRMDREREKRMEGLAKSCDDWRIFCTNSNVPPDDRRFSQNSLSSVSICPPYFYFTGELPSKLSSLSLSLLQKSHAHHHHPHAIDVAEARGSK